MTDAELAVLSLIAEGPQYDHDIQSMIEARNIRDWAAIGFSSVYYVLGKLEEEALIEGHLMPELSGPARTRYQITDSGQRVLHTAITDRLSIPHEHSTGFALGLALMHLLRPDQIRHALNTYESRLRSQIAFLNERRAQSAGDRPSLQQIALADYGLHMLLAEMTWLSEFQQAWEGEQKAQGAPPPLAQRNPMRSPIVRTPPTEPSTRTAPMSAPDDDQDE